MKTKILGWLKATQKATGALLGAAGVLGSVTFLPAPWGRYVAIASVILTWVATYFLPYVSKVVETAPTEVLTGEVIEPKTDEIPVVSDETAGIPVIVDDSQHEFVPPFTGAISVQDVLRRLAEEQTVPA